MIQQRATLYADKAHIPPEIFAVRNDTGRELVAEIADYTIPSGAAAEIRATLPDGTTATAAGTIDGQTVTAPLDDLLTAEGRAAAQIRITNGGEVTTFGFLVDVTEDLAGDTEEATAGPAEVATFETDAALPLTSLVVEIEPKQDLNGYEKPWPAGGGANLVDKANTIETATGLTITVSNDGTVKLNGTSSGVSYVRGVFYCPDQSGTYTWATFNSYASANLQFSVRKANNDPAGGWDTLGSVNKTKTFTIDSGAIASKWQLQVNAGTYSNVEIKPMIVSGSTAPSSYAPYSNICPITGTESVTVARVGKNFLPTPSTWTMGKSLNNATGAERDLADAALTGFIPLRITAANSYYMSGLGYADTDRYYRTYVAAYNANKEFLGRTGGVFCAEYPLTVSSFSSGTPQGTGDIAFIRVTIYPVTGYTASLADIIAIIDNTAQIERGSTATAYEPYNGETLTTDLGRTVYGGTVDIVTGELTVDQIYIPLRGASGTAVGYGSIRRFYTTASMTQYEAVTACDSLQPSETYVPNRLDYASLSTDGRLVVTPTWGQDLTTADAFNAELPNNPINVVARLKTPEIYQLTPAQILALLGGNTIYSDAGQVTVKYRREAAA